MSAAAPTVHLATATGDDPARVGAFYAAFAGRDVDVSHLSLFTMPTVADVRAHLLAQDVVWVGGGSVANLLAVWRVHGLDEVLAEAWRAGVVLGGVSAGSLCWHAGGTTDSFDPDLRPVTNGPALLPHSNSVHHDSEPRRRPLYRGLVGTERCRPATPPRPRSGWSTAAPSWWRRPPTGPVSPPGTCNAPQGSPTTGRRPPRPGLRRAGCPDRAANDQAANDQAAPTRRQRPGGPDQAAPTGELDDQAAPCRAAR